MPLGARGQRIYDYFTDPNDGMDALALEAARAADRLDELDRVIHGKGVLELMKFRVLNEHISPAGDVELSVKVEFQSVLAEARQQQANLAKLIDVLVKARSAKGGSPRKADPAGDDQGTALSLILGGKKADRQ